jgi:DNA-binding PadR family transcriptional regulator
MSVPMTLLGLLEREPSHGYDLKRDYDAYFGRGKPLSFGQLYATLARLDRDGKAIAGPAEAGGGPDRKRYVITGSGTSDVERWLSEPAPPEPGLHSALFTKVLLAVMLGRPAGRFLEIQRAAHPPGTPGGRRRARGGAVADRAVRHQRGQQPERPLRLA